MNLLYKTCSYDNDPKTAEPERRLRIVRGEVPRESPGTMNLLQVVRVRAFLEGLIADSNWLCIID